MRELTHERAAPPQITEPSAPSVGVPTRTELFECTAPGCGQRFRKVMILARHFNTNHENLRADKDTWRQYSKEVTE